MWRQLLWAGTFCSCLQAAPEAVVDNLNMAEEEETSAAAPAPIKISGARVRVLAPKPGRRMPGTQTPAADPGKRAVVFMSISNQTNRPVSLNKVKAASAEKVVLCRCPHAIDGLPAAPKPLNTVTLEAGEKNFKLKSGGNCLLLSGITKPLHPGEEFFLRLDFGAGISVPVRARIGSPLKGGNLSGVLCVPSNPRATQLRATQPRATTRLLSWILSNSTALLSSEAYRAQSSRVVRKLTSGQRSCTNSRLARLGAR